QRNSSFRYSSFRCGVIYLEIRMQSKLPRAYVVELVGTFGFVYFAAAVAVLNVLTAPASADSAQAGAATLTLHEPGLVGIALAQVQQATLYGCTGVELVLTFFLVYAIFAAAKDPVRSAQAAWLGGAVAAAAILVGFPLTGAGLNPARWFGPVLVGKFLLDATP